MIMGLLWRTNQDQIALHNSLRTTPKISEKGSYEIICTFADRLKIYIKIVEENGHGSCFLCELKNRGRTFKAGYKAVVGVNYEFFVKHKILIRCCICI